MKKEELSSEQREEVRKIVREEIKKVNEQISSTFTTDVSDTDNQIIKADKTTSNLLSALKDSSHRR